MKISCNIIRDILPLYVEDMVSEDTRALVDAHLTECDSCAAELAELSNKPKVPAEVNLTSLKRVGDSIRRRRVLAAMAAVMTLLTVFVSAVIYLMTPYYLSAEEAIEGVEVREEGILAIDLPKGYLGHASWAYMEEDQMGHLVHTTRYDWFQGRQEDEIRNAMTREELEAYVKDRYQVNELTQRHWDRFHSIYLEFGTWKTAAGDFVPYDPETCLEGEGELVWQPEKENHWYVNIHDGTAQSLIWGDEISRPSKPLVEVTYGLTSAIIGAAVLMLVLWLAAWRTRGTVREILIRLAILCGCILASAVLVTGGNIVVVDALADYKWPGYIATESVFLVLTALLWHQLYRIRKQDKTV